MLRGYGIHDKLFDWIKEFYLDRTQYVTVGVEHSEDVAVMRCVPQGSVLGPILFIYFINDTPEILKCFKTFADTKVYTAIQSDENRRLLQNNTDSWCSGLRTGRSNLIMIHVKFYTMGKIIQSSNILWMAGSFSV